MEDKESEQYGRDRWEQLAKVRKAIAEGDEEGVESLLRELSLEPAPGRVKALTEGIARQLKEVASKVWDAEQQPNIARCVLAAMVELGNIGVWDKERNSTFDLAFFAEEAYKKAEKKRAEYLAVKAAYKREHDAYLNTEASLAINLINKFLEPLQDNLYNPLNWYLPASRLIEICKSNNVTLTVSTLRKYQRLGLIPKPIRLGRKAHYSIITALRVVMINHCKKQGLVLGELNESVDGSLKLTFESYAEKYPGDRTALEVGCLAMRHLTDGLYEDLVQRVKGWVENGGLETGE